MVVKADGSERCTASLAEAGEAEDRALVERAVGGDGGAFERLVEMHQRQVARTAYRLLGWRGEVEDVVQDVFAAALVSLKRFRWESTLRSWLTSLTVNRCRKERRRRMVRRMLWGRWGGGVRRSEQAADEAAMAGERLVRVRKAVRELAGRYREVVVLRYLEGMEINEIGKALGISRGAVEVRLHRGRGQLKETLAGLVEG